MSRVAAPDEKRQQQQYGWGQQGHPVFICVEHNLEIHGDADASKHFRTHSWYSKWTPWGEFYERGLIKVLPNCHYLIRFCRRDHPLPKFIGPQCPTCARDKVESIMKLPPKGLFPMDKGLYCKRCRSRFIDGRVFTAL